MNRSKRIKTTAPISADFDISREYNFVNENTQTCPLCNKICKNYKGVQVHICRSHGEKYRELVVERNLQNTMTSTCSNSNSQISDVLLNTATKGWR